MNIVMEGQGQTPVILSALGWGGVSLLMVAVAVLVTAAVWVDDWDHRRRWHRDGWCEVRGKDCPYGD